MTMTTSILPFASLTHSRTLTTQTTAHSHFAAMAKDLGKVEQSPADDRAYRALELENGLQASMLGLGGKRGKGQWGRGTACDALVDTLCNVSCVSVGALSLAHFAMGSFIASPRA